MSPEQQELSDAVGQFAARHAPIATTRDSFDDLAAGRVPGWWDALVANGFHAVHLPEDLGGQGGRPIDAACVLEAAGKSLLPGPLLSTVDDSPADESVGVLTGFVTGAAATAFSALPADEQRATALAHARRLFPHLPAPSRVWVNPLTCAS